MSESSKVARDLKALRERAGLSVRATAEAIGRQGSSYAYYEDEFKKRALPLDLVESLIPVFGAHGVSAEDVLRLAGVTGAEAGKRGGIRQVPVIDYTQAGTWREIADMFEPGDGMDFIAVEPGVVGARAFALEIVGSSMEPRFQEGDRVLMDPDVAPQPGKFVVAKRDEDDAATFKKYRPRGADKKRNPIIELVPLNGDWPTLVIDAAHPGTVIATMIEHRSRK